MATTKRGIYHPEDYNKVADVIKDMEQMATTTDEAMDDLEEMLQPEITNENKLSSDLVDDTNRTNKFVTAAEKAQIATNTQDISDIQAEQTTQNNLIETLQLENEELKQETKGLRNASYKVKGTGEIVTLNKTSKNKFVEFGVGGNRYQATRSGKNLAQQKGGTFTLRDNLTVNNQNNKTVMNGTMTGHAAGTTSFTVDGTAITNYALNLSVDNTIELTAGTYTLSLHNITGSYSGISYISLFLLKKNETTPHTNMGNFNFENGSKTFTIAEDGEYFIAVWIQYEVGANITFTNYSFQVMLEKGSTATEYEEYGVMPSPDYPSEIQAVRR